MTVPRILAFAGSLRKDSYNKKLVQIAVRGAERAVLVEDDVSTIIELLQTQVDCSGPRRREAAREFERLAERRGGQRGEADVPVRSDAHLQS